MPTVINFYTWEKERVKEMIETNEVVHCPSCITYGQDSFYICEDCDNSGYVESALFVGILNADYKEYFTIVVNDLKGWCHSEGEDFFFHIGQFIKESDYGIRSIR